MEGWSWIRTGGAAALLGAGIWALRVLLDRRGRRRVRRVWEGAASLTGLRLDPGRAELEPGLTGDRRGHRVRVRGSHRSGLRSAVDLDEPSPVRLKIRREGTLAVLGRLARAGFRPDRVDDSEILELEGDPEAVRSLLTGRLRALLVSQDEWELDLAGRQAVLARPAMPDTSARIVEDIDLLCELAEGLQESRPSRS